MAQIGVLLVNLGTPKSPSTKDVKQYLKQFLLDPRVIDMHWLFRQLLVRGFIIPFRKSHSAKCYKRIWTGEGSPLLVHSVRLAEALQQELGKEFVVALAMRYQEPSIAHALAELQHFPLKQLLIVPLFPQYASARVGTVHEEVMRTLGRWEVIPQLHFVSEFADNPLFIEAWSKQGRRMPLSNYDHVLFSFHGLPETMIRKASKGLCCYSTPWCCDMPQRGNVYCYRAQSFTMARLIAAAIGIPPTHYTICFQSRLGKDKWIQPYASDVIHHMAAKGFKRILVFSPSFVCDCLETLYEIEIEYRELFQGLGGELLDLVPSLNAEGAWVEALKGIVMEAVSPMGAVLRVTCK